MKIRQAFLFSTFGCLCFASPAFAQLPNPATPATPEKIVEITKSKNQTDETKSDVTTTEPSKTVETRTPETAPQASPTPPETQKPISEAAKTLPDDVPENIKANRRGQMSEEEAAVIPYYNNFLTNYYIGPEDVISVSVFGQDKYSKAGITVPPNGKISYPLIREGVLVAGKTVEEIADEITKKLDEFIIDPKVMVSLDRAVSARYSVLGDVGRPGAQIMTRRLSVYQAIAEAGGVLPTGNKKEVIVLRNGADGRPYPIIVNLKDIERGKAAEMVYLVPGDQVIVQGNKIKAWQKLLNLIPIVGFARGIFTGGF